VVALCARYDSSLVYASELDGRTEEEEECAIALIDSKNLLIKIRMSDSC
jgi:hypothetical protein